MNNNKEIIINVLKEVYDPEFPIVDIYTLGLIIDINIDEKKFIINILMTLTSPMCPMGDMIIDMVKNSISSKFPNYNTDVELTFDVMWNLDMIKDEDLKKMFM